MPIQMMNLKTIAMNSINTIPNNPFFKGENLENKICLIIYHKNKPIGFNIMFDYDTIYSKDQLYNDYFRKI